jgi:hypothetical protein
MCKDGTLIPIALPPFPSIGLVFACNHRDFIFEFCSLEVWPGYITAVEVQEGGLQLLLDVTHKVLRTETVLDKM